MELKILKSFSIFLFWRAKGRVNAVLLSLTLDSLMPIPFLDKTAIKQG
jgi:hypothetical protein